MTDIIYSGVTMWILEHYTFEKFIYHRRIGTISICVLGIIYTWLYPVNLPLVLLQYLLCFILVEVYSHRNKVTKYFKAPTITVTPSFTFPESTPTDPPGSPKNPPVTPKTPPVPPRSHFRAFNTEIHIHE